MTNRLLWTLILSVGGAALYFGIARPHVSTIPSAISDPLADLKPSPVPPLAPPVVNIPEIPPISLPALRTLTRIDPIPGRPEVPIQDQATIDFSTGAPVVKMHGKDQDALDAALKEMAEVVKDTKIERKK